MARANEELAAMVSKLLVGGVVAVYLAVGGSVTLSSIQYALAQEVEVKTKASDRQAAADPTDEQSEDETAAAVNDGSEVLDTIVITGAGDRNAISGSGFQGTPDWVYETPTATSVISRQAIQSKPGARDPRNLLGGVAGVYVNSESAHSPAISPNIRGVQDMGRVVISIDGARQNANRTQSGGSNSYIGSAGKAFVDTAFIRAVEVERSTGSKAGLAGSLAGAVTFRTVSADDLIQDGRKWGIETNKTFGDNGQHFSGSMLAAARIGDSPFSIIGGVSRQNIGNYQMGKHGKIAWSGSFMEPEETKLMGRDNWSGLLKFEGDFGAVKTALAWTHQQKKFAWVRLEQFADSDLREELALTDTVTANLEWNPADNKLIDLRARLWLNNTQEKTLRHYTSIGRSTVIINAEMMSYGFSIDNNSRFDGKLGGLTLNYGVEAFRDDADSRATSDDIKKNPALESNFTSFSPSGRRDLASGFVNAAWEPVKWATLSAGLRYDWYRLKGSPTYYGYVPPVFYRAQDVESEYDYRTRMGCYATLPPLPRHYTTRGEGNGGCGSRDFYRVGASMPEKNTPEQSPAYTLDIDRSDGAWLPSASIEFKPVDWLRPYVSYSRSYRPPATAEAFFTGALPGFNRPNNSFAANEFLRPEKAETWEVGVDISRNTVFTKKDSLRLKISAFDRTIRDYIVNGRLFPSANAAKNYIGYVNTIGNTKMRGIEFEANYDAGNFWIGGSATYMEMDLARKTQRYWYGRDLGLTGNNVVLFASRHLPPRFNAVIDAGIRLSEEKFVIGGRVTRSMPTLSVTPTERYVTNPYTKLDLYGSFKISDHATLRVSIDNVNDVNHVSPGGRYPEPGRTFLASLQTRW